MVMDRRIGTRIPANFKKEESLVRIDAGPYIGRVKNNLDPARSGRLQVYIPDLASGDDSNPDNWRTVSYASPFMGFTFQPDTNKQNNFKKVRHSYGFWAVPPDIGNLVLCLFIGGDPNQGFWFACVPSQLGHHMIPGIAGSYDVDTSNIENAQVKANYSSGPTVVAEFNENLDNSDWSSFTTEKKPIHEDQYRIYLNQGLDKDYVRGIISSTSQRESPSFVFGISTPGRPHNDPATSSDYAEKIKSGNLKEKDYAISSRRGGHTFIMDDGSFQGKDRLVRLRTAGGHQILMNDSEDILYIGNSTGSVWIELTGNGHLNIYSGNSINVRSQQDINFHADRNINLNAGNDILMAAGKNWQVQARTVNVDSVDTTTLSGGGKLNLGSNGSVNIAAGGITNVTGSSGVNVSGSRIKLNNGVSSSAKFSRPDPLKFNKLSDTNKQGDRWVSVDRALQSIVTIAPTHEPWSLHQKTEFAGVTATSISRNRNIREPAPTTETVRTTVPTRELDPGPKSATNQGATNTLNRSYMNRADTPIVTEGVGNLTPEQTLALIQQIGWNESRCRYNVVNRLNFCGKYQFGAAALTDLGYIKLDAYRKYGGNRTLNYSSSWTGKDGITSKEEFLSNGPVQEKIMISWLKLNYNYLTRNGGIKPGDDQATVAGMLSVSHLLGAQGAKKWRETGSGVDANGTTGTTYFNDGRYAVNVLARTSLET